MALRVMAGFEKSDSYFLPRSRAHPSDELCNMMWPWLDGALAEVSSDQFQHPTALHFLEFLLVLRSIILQDAAAMFVLLKDGDVGEQRRLRHVVFTHPVFKSDLFESFVNEMDVLLTEQRGNDPNDAIIDRAMPGVNRRFDELVRMMAEMHGDVVAHDQKLGNIEEQLREQVEQAARAEESAAKRHRDTATTMAGVLQTGASFIYKSIEGQDVMLEPAVAAAAEAEWNQARQQVQVEEAATTAENKEDVLVRVMGHQVSFRRKNIKKVLLSSIYKEYYGLEQFAGLPIDGGLHGLESSYKSVWRGGYSASDNVYFSRMKSLVVAMAAKAGVEEGGWNDSVEAVGKEWQRFLTHGGLAGAVKKLQVDGLVVKKGSRHRKAAPGS
jgi:hypothetical protein